MKKIEGANFPDPEIDQSHEQYIHSDVWDNLVENDDDLVGMIAYGLYQHRKRSWIKQYQELNGNFPTEAQIKDFSFAQKAAALHSLREDAEGKMFRFGEEYAEAKMLELQSDAFNFRTINEIKSARDKLSEIHDDIRSHGGYIHHVKMHVAGFFALAALIALGSFLVHWEKSPAEVANLLIPHGQETHSGVNLPAANNLSTGEMSDAPKPQQQPLNTAPHSTPAGGPLAMPSPENKPSGKAH